MAYAYHRAFPALAGVFLAVVVSAVAATAARAQATPQIVAVPAGNHPPIPSGMVPGCRAGPDGPDSPTCPVIQYGDITTWTYGFLDNRIAYGLVSYDAKGAVVRSVVRPGARYLYKITSDPAARTLTLWGQGDGKVTVPWSDLPQVPPTVIQIPVAGRPPVPAGMMALCTTGPEGDKESSICPVISYRNAYTWAFSFIDNRFSLGITSYDGQAHQLKSVEKQRSRYVYKITVEPAAQTVTFWGQHDLTIVMPWSELP